MVKVVQKDNKELYQCEECGFYYEDREWADPPSHEVTAGREVRGMVSGAQELQY